MTKKKKIPDEPRQVQPEGFGCLPVVYPPGFNSDPTRRTGTIFRTRPDGLVLLRIICRPVMCGLWFNNYPSTHVCARNKTGGRDPPLAQCGLWKIIVETLSNVGHHLGYRVERLWTLCRVSYLVQCLHKDFLKAHFVQGGGPGHLWSHSRLGGVFLYFCVQKMSWRTGLLNRTALLNIR